MATDDEEIVPAPALNFSADNVVTLLVGPDEEKLLVHEHRLSHSAFFGAALKKEWLEGQTRVIKLPVEAPVFMAHYIEYAYRGKLPTHIYTTDSPGDKKEAGYELLAELYVTGERLLDSAIRNAIISEILRIRVLRPKDGVCWNPTTTPANIVYRGTPEGSPARRLMTDLTLRMASDKWHTPDADQQFLYDLVQGFLRMNTPKALERVRGMAMKAEDYFV